MLAVCPEGWLRALKHLPPFRKCRPEMATLPPRQQKDSVSPLNSWPMQGDWGVTVDRQISSIVLFSLTETKTKKHFSKAFSFRLFLSPSSSSSSLPRGVSVYTPHNSSFFSSQTSSRLPHGVRMCTPHNSSLFSSQASSRLPHSRIYMSSAYPVITLAHPHWPQPCAIASLAKCGPRRTVLSY